MACDVIEAQHPLGHSHHHYKGRELFLELRSLGINTSLKEGQRAQSFKCINKEQMVGEPTERRVYKWWSIAAGGPSAEYQTKGIPNLEINLIGKGGMLILGKNYSGQGLEQVFLWRNNFTWLSRYNTHREYYTRGFTSVKKQPRIGFVLVLIPSWQREGVVTELLTPFDIQKQRMTMNTC